VCCRRCCAFGVGDGGVEKSKEQKREKYVLVIVSSVPHCDLYYLDRSLGALLKGFGLNVMFIIVMESSLRTRRKL